MRTARSPIPTTLPPPPSPSRFWPPCIIAPTRAKINSHPDYIASATLALSVLAALHHRANTGEDQFIETAQVEGTAAAMEVAFLNYFANGRVAASTGNRDANAVPQGCYPCLGHDTWCVVSCTTEAQWQALAQILGGDDLASAPRFATAAERWRRHDELDDLISAWTQQHTPHQAMQILQSSWGSGRCCADWRGSLARSAPAPARFHHYH